jgi:hypothetical protein
VNECPSVTCHENATCINTEGSYRCQCKSGFVGDGVNNCIGKLPFEIFLYENVCKTPLRNWKKIL